MKLKLLVAAVAMGATTSTLASLVCSGRENYADGTSTSYGFAMNLDRHGELHIPEGVFFVEDVQFILYKADVVFCTADGPELPYVLNKFNVHMTRDDASRVRWFGDTAKFILGNIDLAQF